MPHRPAKLRRKQKTKARARRQRARRFRLFSLLPGTSAARYLRALWRWPATVHLTACAAVVFVLWLGTNWTYQVVRKPSELFFPISSTGYKTPSHTWRTYAPLFRKHSTSVMTPELLAAIAQVEGSGNPVARTYWRWSLTLDPFDIFRPASSAVGMYQITDGTFAEARRYCIHDHRVATVGRWHELRSCWFNGLYTRVIPSHAIEMTSAYLDRRVTRVLERESQTNVTLEQKQHLAAVIHLCGAGAGARYARSGLQARSGQKCGAHDLRAYLAKVDRMKRTFERLAAGG